VPAREDGEGRNDGTLTSLTPCAACSLRRLPTATKDRKRDWKQLEVMKGENSRPASLGQPDEARTIAYACENVRQARV